MKTKDLLSRMMLLLAVLLAGAGTAWAEEIAYKTLTFSSSTNSKGVSSYTNEWTATIDNFTWNLANFNNSNNAWTYVRCGSKNAASTATISTSAAIDQSISKVVVTVDKTANCSSNSLTVASDKDFTENVQTITGASLASGDVTYTIPSPAANLYYKLTFAQTKGANGDTQISKVVYYKSDTPTPGKEKVATINGISPVTVNVDDEGTFTLDATFPEGLTAGDDYEVTWATSDEDVLAVNKTTGEYQAYAKGTVTITVNVEALDEDTYENVSKTFEVKVFDPNANDGLSEAKAFTVAEAIEAIDAGVDDKTTYYVKGIISQIDSYNSTYGSIYYWISDDGTTTNQFECYSGLNIGGEKFTSTSDLSVGDEVVVKGTMKKFNSIYEFSYNNEIVTRKTDERVNIATINGISPLTVNVNEEGEFVLDIDFAEEAADDDYEVTLTSSDDNKLTVEKDGSYLTGDNAGSVTLTVTVEPVDDETYKTVSKEFTITIVDPNVKGTETNPYTVADVIAMTTAPSEKVYVKGYIVGTYNNGSKNNFARTGAANTNLALADNADESNVDNTIALQLENNALRTNFNATDKPYNIGVAQIVVQGSIVKYITDLGVKTPSSITKVAEQVSITDKGMATYYTDCALDFTDCENIYAYTATLSGYAITFTRVRKVPANTGVLLRNPNGGVAKETVPVVNGQAETVGGNKFVGTLTDKTVDTEGYYILSTGSNGLGFYKVKSEGGSKVAAHRAYLDATGAAKSRAFIGFNDDEATGVNAMDNGQWTMDNVYNLQGVRVAQPTKGLYIVNGKKVIFK